MDMEDLYDAYLDAQHFESEYKVQTTQHRRNRREKRELKNARKEMNR